MSQSEWTSYLKKAVATAERGFDQLLEDTSSPSAGSQADKSRSGTPEPRLSMQERLKGAVGSGGGSPRQSADGDRPSSEVARTSVDVERDVMTPESGTPLTDSLTLEKEELAKLSQEALLDLVEKLQNDTTTSAELVDSLQSKVALLASQEAERAKQHGAPNSKKLAEKDRQIALLIEEGTNLSKKELTYMNTIKKLRSKVKHGETLQEGFEKIRVRLEKEVGTAKEKLKTVEGQTLKVNEEMKILKRKVQEDAAKGETGKPGVSPEVVSELEELQKTHQGLKKQHLEEKTARQRLERELAAAKATHESFTSTLQEQISELRQSRHAESSAAQTVHGDLRLEISRLEARVEHFRGLNEEAVARNSDENTAKLLNQIEKINSQHSLSQDNWRGIELSLQGKISKLETDISELKQREAALIKKNKSLQSEIRSERDEIASLQDELGDVNEQVFKGKKVIDKLRGALKEQLKDCSETSENNSTDTSEVDGYRQRISELESMTAALEEKVEERDMRLAARDDADMAIGSDRRTSEPMDSPLETPFAGLSHPTSPVASFSPYDRSFGDRSFERSFEELDQQTELDSRRSGQQGPSIQVIGRMSSQVRKLTSEVSNLKEELARVASDKDEASREVARLMTENDELSEAKITLDSAEARLAYMEKRESQALEMLGEKEEKISELRADITDMRELYSRQISDLVDQLVEAKK